MSSSEIDTSVPDAEPVDPVTAPAIRLACDRCGAPALLRPGGLCADCVSAVGLAEDRAEYVAWRSRVEEAITAGAPDDR